MDRKTKGRVIFQIRLKRTRGPDTVWDAME
jgi:hypothetical protein